MSATITLNNAIDTLKDTYLNMVSDVKKSEASKNVGRKKARKERIRESHIKNLQLINTMMHDPEVDKFCRADFGPISTPKCQMTKQTLARGSKAKMDLIQYLIDTYQCNSEIAKMAIPRIKYRITK